MRLRKRLFIDHRVQGTLLLRVVAYWCCCVLAVGLSLLTWRLLTEPVQPAYQYFADAWHFALTAAIATALVLPLVIYDILTISNRFTGPLYRLRRELRRLAAGEPVPPVRFRNGDFWPELADEFNATAQRMEMLTNMAESGRTTTGTSARAATKKDLRETPSSFGKQNATTDADSEPNTDNLPDHLFEMPRGKR